jgi:dynein heavy chain, axonemal
LQTAEDLARLWVHESQRVYGDKMADERDCDTFNKTLSDICKKCFEVNSSLLSVCAVQVTIQFNFQDIEETLLTTRPNIYCHFAGGLGESRYLPIPHWESLSKLLHEALSNYNELVSAMQLVLFEDAMMHICRLDNQHINLC